MSFSERIQKLDQEVAAVVERALSQVRREVTERLRAGSEEVLRRLEEFTPELPSSFVSREELEPLEQSVRSAARSDAFGELREALSTVDRARSQAEILGALLAASERFASRAAVLLARPGEVKGWGARGFGDADSAVRELALDPAEGAWRRLAEADGAVKLSAAECADLCSRLESSVPRDGALVPIVLRDRLAAALYADRIEDGELLLEALQALTYAAAQAIELLPFRERPATSTLHLAGDAAAPASEPEPAEGTAEAAEAPAAASGTGAETAAFASTAPETSPDEAEPAPAGAAAEPEEEAPAPEPLAAAELPAASLAEDETAAAATSPEPSAAARAWEVPESPEAPASPAVPAAAEEAPQPEAPAPAGAKETVLLSRSQAFGGTPDLDGDETHPGTLRAVPAAGFEPAGSGEPSARTAQISTAGPEVRPPSGVQGPGWAFATTRVPVSPSDEAQHDEARRLARLLVSEIKLYNEEQVEEGRRNHDVYERLKEDIDRSRQMYEERVEARILQSTDYFYQELVRILGAGDSRALGI